MFLHLAGYALLGAAITLFTRGPRGVAPIILAPLVMLGFLVLVAADAWRSTRSATTSRRRTRWLSAAALVLFSATVGDLYLGWLKGRVGEAFKITGPSMAPTLLVGDYVLIAPQVDDVRRDQLLVWNDTSGPRLHRVVGVPGDTLQMAKERLIRNGAAVREPYVQYTEGVSDTIPARTWGPLVVPSDSVFLLGDNRDNSYDSRYMGFIPLENVRGRPTRVYLSRDPVTGHVRWDRFGTTLDTLAPAA